MIRKFNKQIKDLLGTSEVVEKLTKFVVLQYPPLRNIRPPMTLETH